MGHLNTAHGNSWPNKIWNIPEFYFYFIIPELLTLPEHPSSPLGFSRVHITRSLVLCVMFCRPLFVLFKLSIVLYVLLWLTDNQNPLIWLPLWHLQTLLMLYEHLESTGTWLEMCESMGKYHASMIFHQYKNTKLLKINIFF
jgi:hypothetical protein